MLLSTASDIAAIEELTCSIAMAFSWSADASEGCVATNDGRYTAQHPNQSLRDAANAASAIARHRALTSRRPHRRRHHGRDRSRSGPILYPLKFCSGDHFRERRLRLLAGRLSAAPRKTRRGGSSTAPSQG